MPLSMQRRDFYGSRVTPFSRINLNGHPAFHECLETMNVELEQAVLVIRGVVKGQEVEFQVGSLRTEGDMNGMVLIHTAEYDEVSSGYGLVGRYRTHSEHRLLLDCELLPDKSGHAYTVRMRDQDS